MPRRIVSENIPSQDIVRRFSDRMQDENPADPLHRGLSAKVAHDRGIDSRKLARSQWNALFNDVTENVDSFVTDEEDVLLAQSKKLFAAWEKFQKALPKEQRKDVTSKPDLKLLFGAVQTSSNTWKQQSKGTKRGKVKSAFSNLCQHLQDHQGMLSILPDQSEYFSLLCGSLTTVILAGANHKAIAEAVETTLEELGHKIGFWNRQIELHGKVTHMYRYIVELYVIVFEFLTQVFDTWSKSSVRRFMTSFNENVLKDLFEEKRSRMAAIEVYMEREARLESDKRTRQQLDELRAAKDELLQSTRLILQNQAMSVQSMQELRLSLGASVQKLLEERQPTSTSTVLSIQQGTVDEDTDTEWVAVHKDDASITTESSPESGNDNDDNFLTHDEIVDKIACLKTKYEKDIQYIMELIARANKFEIDTRVERRLDNWINKPVRDAFWIQGPYGVSKPSQNTSTAIFVTALARRSNLSCIAHLCHLEDAHSRVFTREASLINMLTSLIIQLVLLTPVSQLTDLASVHQHLETLNAGSLSFEEALDLLLTLRPVGPPLLLIVIDSMQFLEDRSDPEQTIRLLRTIGVLCNLDAKNEEVEDDDNGDGSHAQHNDTRNTKASNLSSATKICFTTDGYMDALGQAASIGLFDKVEFASEADDADADLTTTLTL